MVPARVPVVRARVALVAPVVPAAHVRVVPARVLVVPVVHAREGPVVLRWVGHVRVALVARVPAALVVPAQVDQVDLVVPVVPVATDRTASAVRRARNRAHAAVVTWTSCNHSS